MPDRFFWLALIVVVLLVAVIVGMVVSLRRRARAQADLDAPGPADEALGAERQTQEALHVATTRAGDPYDRVVVAGLGFRARGTVSVHDEGVQLRLDGGVERVIPARDVVGAGRGTWTIDRTVEPDGLVLLRWRLGDGEVESCLRVDDPAALVAALDALVSTAFYTATAPATASAAVPATASATVPAVPEPPHPDHEETP